MTPHTSTRPLFAASLRDWRQHRGESQQTLANRAGISTRHLSFLETGRARASEGMVLRLADALDLPYQARNEMLAEAGFHPRFGVEPASGLEALPEAVRNAAALILANHDPYPALCLNSAYDILAANAGFGRLADSLAVAPGGNLLHLIFDPGSVRDAIVNWEALAALIHRRILREMRYLGPRSLLARRYAEIAPHLSDLPVEASILPAEPALAIEFRIGGETSAWLTTVTTLGTAQDALTEGLLIEQYFPVPVGNEPVAPKG